MTTKTVYRPQTCANPTDRYLAQVRVDGWIIDIARFDTEPQANEWLAANTHTDIQPSVGHAYARMLKGWN